MHLVTVSEGLLGLLEAEIVIRFVRYQHSRRRLLIPVFGCLPDQSTLCSSRREVRIVSVHTVFGPARVGWLVAKSAPMLLRFARFLRAFAVLGAAELVEAQGVRHRHALLPALFVHF